MAGRTNPDQGTVGRWISSHNHRSLALSAIGVWLKSRGSSFPKDAHALLESDWLEILKLSAKISIVFLKLKYARLKEANLSGRSLKLARQKRQLLLQKVNHVLGQPGCVSNTNNFFSSLCNIHNGEIEPKSDSAAVTDTPTSTKPPSARGSRALNRYPLYADCAVGGRRKRDRRAFLAGGRPGYARHIGTLYWSDNLDILRRR